MYETVDVWKDFGTIIEKSKVANENIIKNSDLKIFPNPAIDYLIVESNDISIGKDINVYALNGSLIYRQKITETKSVIDVSGYPTGIYIVNIDKETAKFVKK
jgi:hypothetical protein